jgi:hypothetical protein
MTSLAKGPGRFFGSLGISNYVAGRGVPGVSVWLTGAACPL